VRKAQKQVAEENKPKTVIITVEKAELGASNGKALCISGVDVGVDVAAVRETVTKAMEHKAICGGVAEKGDKGKVDVAEWLSNALGRLKGRCGQGKGGLATAQVSYSLISFI